MDETIFLNTPEFKVTTSKVVAGSTTYALANITSATIKGAPGVHKTHRATLLVLSVLAIYLFATGHPVFGTMSLMVAGAGIPSALLPYELILTTGAAEQHALKSGDRSVIERAAKAIEDAIAARR